MLHCCSVEILFSNVVFVLLVIERVMGGKISRKTLSSSYLLSMFVLILVVGDSIFWRKKGVLVIFSIDND